MKNVAPKCGSSDKRNAEYLEAFSPQNFFQSLVTQSAPIILDVGTHRGESVRVFLKRSFLNARSTHSNPILRTLRNWKSVVLRSIPLSGGWGLSRSTKLSVIS